MSTRNLHFAIARTHARGASGLIRTLVVGSATLAILLVCFSMYQYLQVESNGPVDERASSAPRNRTEPSGISSSSGDIPATEVGHRGVGPGEHVSLTIYPREGNEARFEIEVRDWTPVAGAANEFRLVEPTVRMRTSDDHAVRVTAQQGMLEAKRRGGAGLDPQRGKLGGGVVIEYDRLTAAQREQLPPEQRDEVDPADIVRIEMENLEFDLEYAKLIIPGPLRLEASDVLFEAANLELRFNESQNRVESLRISGGGRIELRGTSSLVVADGGSAATPHTVAEWLLETIRAKLAAQASDPAAPARQNASDAVASVTPAGSPVASEGAPDVVDGIPVFRANDLDEEKPVTPLHYLARFDGSIDAAELLDEQTLSRLQADSLEILRDFADGAVPAADRAQVAAKRAAAAAAPKVDKRIVLSWSDRLVVQAMDSNDVTLAAGVRARMTATGSPARISYSDGDAVCRQLIFEPDGTGLWLHGSESDPVVVRFANASSGRGTLTGTAVHHHVEGPRFAVDVTGPGTLLTRSEEPPDGKADIAAAQPPSNARAARNQSIATAGLGGASFEEKLELVGYTKSKTIVDFTGVISEKSFRIVEKATFTGRTSVRQDAAQMDADMLELRFTVRETWRDLERQIEGFTGTGHVVLTTEEDRLACRELDVSLITDGDGKVWPKTAVARGDVDALQGDRTLKARDELVVDFELYRETPQSPPQAELIAGINGVLSASDDEAGATAPVTPPEPAAPPQTRAAATRLRAFGEVEISEPPQGLDVSADRIDCRLAARRGGIEEASLFGAKDRPATVRLQDVTTIGNRINLNVPDEWAEVPGEGRMTIQSYRDLDGSKLDEPRPIVVTWNTGARYQGRENRAVFGGGVHAYSRSTTTFDCQRLEIEFDEVAQTEESPRSDRRWWLFPELLDKIRGRTEDREAMGRRFNREPAVVWAMGNAKAVTTDVDEATGETKTRMRVEGPKLAAYLRSEVSKMLIEGQGNLLLEQFERAPHDAAVSSTRSGELFEVGGASGPSKTLIEWQDMMVYDFAIDQTRFEGAVSLKHFSGQELQKRFGGVPGGTADAAPGRSTYLTCDVLTVDFLGGDQRVRRDRPERMGRLSTSSLRQFDASGRVSLNDVSEGLQVWADKVIYERPRELLAIYGVPSHKARIVKRRAERLPLQMDVERLFYNLRTGMPEISDLDVR